MIMIEQLKQRLSTHQQVLGFSPLEVTQGSYQWLKMRLGVISASRCSVLLQEGFAAPFPDSVKLEKIGNNKFIIDGGGYDAHPFEGTKAQATAYVRDQLPRIPSEMKMAYMHELIAEIATGEPAELVKAKAMEWGNENEPKAREAYAFMMGESVQELPFVYANDAMRCGISPDGVLSDSGIEIKCPFTSKVHTDTLLNENIKDEYMKQMQFSMYVTGAHEWKFMSYDPRMPAHLMTKIIVVKRDEELIAKIDLAVKDFIGHMDKALSKLGLSFGQQWSGTPYSVVEPVKKQSPQTKEPEHKPEFNQENF